MTKVEILRTTDTGQQVLGWFALVDGKIVMHVNHPPDGSGTMRMIFEHAVIWGNKLYYARTNPKNWLPMMTKAYQGNVIRAHPVDDKIAIKPREVMIEIGGPGSGDYGHVGRPKMVGGSGPSAIAVKPKAARAPRVARPYRMGRPDPIEQKLANMPIKPGSKHVLGGGISATYTVTLKDGTEAVWKPDSGAGEDSHQREVAAWEIAQIVGNSDMTAPTASRTIRGSGIGSMQLLEPGSAGNRIDYDPDNLNHDQIERAAVFDYVINNGDRHDGNWMLDPGGKDIHLIDHNLAFGTYASSHLIDMAQNYQETRSTTASLATMARPYIENADEIKTVMTQAGLSAGRIRSVMSNITKLKGMTNWNEL